MRIDQHLTPLAEVLQRVGLDIRVLVLQVINVSLLILSLLLFQELDVCMGLPFVWAEQQKVGSPRTLGISNNDVSRDGGFHYDPPSLLLRYGRSSTFNVVMGWR